MNFPETVRLALFRISALAALLTLATWGLLRNTQVHPLTIGSIASDRAIITEVLPPEGIILPIAWNDLGTRMVSEGVIDAEKFESLYAYRGGLAPDERKLLYGNADVTVTMTPANANILLNLFWAFGLSNENEVLEKGPMQDQRYGGPQNFASTGGWTISRGDAMTHFNAHAFVTLTSEQQALVERVAQHIYRPCCGNSTYFPDCNHGMAMLGLLELMALRGVSEKEMYRVALQVNAYWFPDTYTTLAKYFAMQGIPWKKVDPKLALGEEFSSYAGYSKILSQVTSPTQQGGGSCGV